MLCAGVFAACTGDGNDAAVTEFTVTVKLPDGSPAVGTSEKPVWVTICETAENGGACYGRYGGDGNTRVDANGKVTINIEGLKGKTADLHVYYGPGINEIYKSTVTIADKSVTVNLTNNLD